MTTLPIHYRLPSNPIGLAQVDDSLVEWLQPFTWYMSDNRVVAPPRVSLRVGSTPRFILLNRLVVLLTGLSAPERSTILSKPNWGLLWTTLQAIPPIRFDDGNKWNCQFSNLTLLTPQGQRTSTSSSLSRLQPNPSAIPLASHNQLPHELPPPIDDTPFHSTLTDNPLNIRSTPEPSAKDLLSPTTTQQTGDSNGL